MVKIVLKNPITNREINKMTKQILDITQPDLLLVDFGDHHFDSIDSLRYCKEELIKIEAELLRFKKIAFLSIPPYKSMSKDSKKLKFFHHEENAKKWLIK